MLNRNKTYNYFNSNFALTKSTNNWFRFHNPFGSGSSKSMGVNFKYMRVKDFRSGYNESVSTFIMQYNQVDYKNHFGIIEPYAEIELSLDPVMKSRPASAGIDLPDHFKSFIFENGSLAHRARNWLVDRGFDPEELDYEGFGFCDSGEWIGRIIIPVKEAGELRYWFGRSFIGEYRYKNPPGMSAKNYFFNGDAIHLFNSVYLVEGWSDAKTLGPAGIASLSWSLSIQQISKILNSGLKHLIIIADPEFYLQALLTARTFISYKYIKVVSMDGMPGDVNKTGKEKTLDRIEEFNYLSISNLTQAIIEESEKVKK